MSAHAFLDEREGRDPAGRERDLFARLPAQLAHAKAASPYFASLLARVDAATITDRAALAALPLTRKSQLAELQRSRLPFGGLAATAPGRLARIFMSPGPIYDPEGRGTDYWRTARALHAAGFRAGELVLNCYSYHLSPAGSMFETGLHRLGCAVIPGGTGNTEQQARAIGDLRPSGYVGTPSFVKILLEKCDELGIDSASVKRACVSGSMPMPVSWPGMVSPGTSDGAIATPSASASSTVATP